MAECPFCKGKVAADLTRDGGRCPHCLIEIPGEEAPTNPGEAAKAMQQAEAAAARKGGPPRVLLALLLMVTVGGGALVLSQHEEPPSPMDFSFEMVPLSEHKDLALPQSSGPEAVERSNRPHRDRSGGVANAGGSTHSGSVGAVANAGGAPEEIPQEAGAGLRLPTTSSKKVDMGLGGGPVISVPTGGRFAPTAEVLSDPAAIQEAVGKALNAYVGTLRRCYESALKSNDGLRGKWDVGFMIQTDGHTDDVVVTFMTGKSDKGFEACMEREVHGWTFARIAESQWVNYPVKFGSGF